MRGLADLVALGVILVVGDALAETSLLGLGGVRLAWTDVPILLAAYGVLGGLCGAALWVALALSARIFHHPGLLGEGAAHRRWFVTISIPCYVGAIILQQLRRPVNDGHWLLLGGASLVVLLAVIPLRRRPGSSLAVACGLVGATFILHGATLMHGVLREAIEPARREVLGAGLVLAGLALFGVMLSRRSEPGTAERPALLPGLALLAALVAADLLLWSTAWPVPMDWQVRDAETADRGPVADGPDVLLLVLDTVRADHMDLFGYPRPTMPFLARFAREDCSVAEAAMATSSWSLPSHGSMFTGLWASSHGGHYPPSNDPDPPPVYPMHPDLPTLAGELGRMGYRTAGISGNYGLLAQGLGKGFAEISQAPGAGQSIYDLCCLSRIRRAGTSALDLVRSMLPGPLARRAGYFRAEAPPYRRAEELTGIAIEWLDAATEAPAFLFLNYFDAHQPYLPPDDLDEHFVSRPADLSWRYLPRASYHAVVQGSLELRPEEIQYLVGQYDAELVAIDRQCKRLFEHLERTGRYDDALIIIVSDHGEAFLEHGMLGHGTTLYEPQVLVPLLIKLPKGSPERPPPSIPHMQPLDLLPTVMRVLGGEIPPGVEGSPWGEGRDFALSEVFCREPGNERACRDLLAVRIGEWKYIRSRRGEEECYDLAVDPEERRNILGEKPALEARARALVKEREAGLRERTADVRLSAEALERLRALGYVK